MSDLLGTFEIAFGAMIFRMQIRRESPPGVTQREDSWVSATVERKSRRAAGRPSNPNLTRQRGSGGKGVSLNPTVGLSPSNQRKCLLFTDVTFGLCHRVTAASLAAVRNERFRFAEFELDFYAFTD